MTSLPGRIVIPRIRNNRELSVSGERWRDVLSFDEAALQALLAQVPTDSLERAHRLTDPAVPLEVFLADERMSLWLGSRRLAHVELTR